MEKTNNKPFYKKWWGIILVIVFWPFFLILYAGWKSDWSKPVKTGAISVGLLAIFITLGVALADPSQQNKKVEQAQKPQATPAAPQQTEAPAVKENTSDLNLSVNKRILSLGITNNEEAVLINCEIRINPGIVKNGYTTRADLLPKQEIDLIYNQFTKDTERFDIQKNAVEQVVVTQCKDQTSRFGIYGS